MTVTVVFHDPVTIEDLGSRKALADHCSRAVATGLAAANAGRLETWGCRAPPAWPKPGRRRLRDPALDFAGAARDLWAPDRRDADGLRGDIEDFGVTAAATRKLFVKT